ncbi:MAG: SU10 major capsid protein, partial [Burkholderiaceae bacterium]
TPRTGLANIIGAVDIYSWETGPIAFVPIYNTQIRARTMFLSDGESAKRMFIRPIKKERMGKTGDSSKDMLVTDVTLKVTNRRGMLKIADLT